MKHFILGSAVRAIIFSLAVSSIAQAQIYFLDASKSLDLKTFSPKTGTIQTIYKHRDGYVIQQFTVAPGKRRIAVIESKTEVGSVKFDSIGQPQHLTIIAPTGNVLFQLDSALSVSWSTTGDSVAILKAISIEGEAFAEYEVIKHMGIWLYSFRTNKLMKMTDEAADGIFWAPNKNGLYFALPRVLTHDSVNYLAMGKRQPVPTNLKSIDISPDGKFALFGGGEGGHYSVFDNRSDSSYSLNKYLGFGLEGVWISWGGAHLIFVEGYSTIYAFDAGKRRIAKTFDGRIIALDNIDKQLLLDVPGIGLKAVSFKEIVDNHK